MRAAIKLLLQWHCIVSVDITLIKLQWKKISPCCRNWLTQLDEGVKLDSWLIDQDRIDLAQREVIQIYCSVIHRCNIWINFVWRWGRKYPLSKSKNSATINAVEEIVKWVYCRRLWLSLPTLVVGHMKGCFFVSRYNGHILAGAGRIPGCLEGQIVGASSQGEMLDDLVAIVSQCCTKG